MESAGHIISAAQELYARAEPEPKPTRPPVYKAIGISLAIASGLFIGTSFVLKKVGLLRANVKYNEEAGEGYGYLKNVFWWGGMTLMIVGEICNFVAYAFVDAILVTPLGALSVVITTILSALFLNERLSFVGKIGCFMCIIGSVVIVMNAPSESSVATIQDMQRFVIAPGFLSYAGLIIVVCIFIAIWAGPRYGKRSMLVYLSICSLIGGLSVVATQGLGAAVVAQAGGKAQFNQWFLYVLLVFVIATLVTEIIFLNKALNIFNAALVTPTYYVFFTSSTIITSAILFRGFEGTPTSIVTVVMGFLQICSGVVLLQLSKSAKDVPDTKVFTGDFDQVRTVAEQEEPESEPKADAIRGAAAIIRRFSNSRQLKEVAEAKRVHEERLKDQMEPIGEDELVEWDGLRRRKTLRGDAVQGLERRKTQHPPLGLTRFPSYDEETHDVRPESHGREDHDEFNGGFMNSFRRRALSTFSRGSRIGSAGSSHARHPTPSMAMTEVPLPIYESEAQSGQGQNNDQMDGTTDTSHVFGLPQGLQRLGSDGTMGPSRLSPGPLSKEPQWPEGSARPQSGLAPTPPPHTAKRQFSFQNVFHRRKSDTRVDNRQSVRPPSRPGLGSRGGTRPNASKSGTEEERLGLVKGDSSAMLPLPDYISEDENWQLGQPQRDGLEPGDAEKEDDQVVAGEKDMEYEIERQKWIDSGISPERFNALPRSRKRDSQNPPRDETRSGKGSKDREGPAGGGGGGAFI